MLSADQTPTPTRLIRNCEEVGLFDDLQHVNPFDETFRRAVESDRGDQSQPYDSTKGTKPRLTTQTTLEALTMHNEETLHTPNVLPYLELASTSNKPLKSTISLDDELMEPMASEPKPEAMEEEPNAATTEEEKVSVERNPKENLPQSVVQSDMKPKSLVLVSTVAMPYLIATQPPTTPSAVARPLKKLVPKKAPVVEHPIKEKLKQLILRAKHATTTVAPTMKDKMDQDCIPRVKEESIPRKRTISEKDGSNNERFERNRAAAQRYRVKVKKTQNMLRQRNAELEAENGRLRMELKSIKSILLSHQDCSVTRALNQRVFKPSIFYLIDDNKSKSGTTGKS